MGRTTAIGRPSTVALAVGALLAVAVAGQAGATNFGGPRDAGKDCNTDPVASQCVADTASHTVFIESSVDQGLRDEIVWSVANYTAVTHVTMSITTGSNPDVTVCALNYGLNTPWWASTACDYTAVYGGSSTPLPGTRWCKAQVFRYNLAWRASKYPTDNNERSITCQELGHTIGLRHATSGTSDPDWANSCMKELNQTKITTTTHDRNHV